VVEVSWKPTVASTFLVAIQVEALDPHKLLADVTWCSRGAGSNIRSATVTTDPRPGVAVSPVHLRDGDPNTSAIMVAAVRKVDGVVDAVRVTLGA
jgi:GTP pyrophosphokinase